MRIPHLVLVPLVLALCISCGGGSGFAPTAGVFSGQFIVDAQVIGTFTVNVNGNSFGGGGMLIHNGFDVPVAVSSLITGANITGRVENASLGHGSFTGHFIGERHAEGDFTYTDEGGISTATGTWVADHN